VTRSSARRLVKKTAIFGLSRLLASPCRKELPVARTVGASEARSAFSPR
jgi:hypothetical protein